MYLSRVKLNIMSRETMMALVSPSKFHGAVESSFNGERKRRLWRIDELCANTYILILSEDRPNLAHFSEQFGFSNEYETKDYSPLLEKICNGGKWRFKLTANPTVSLSQKDGRGKVTAYITTQNQKKWLVEKSEKHGFSVDEKEFDVTMSKWYRFYKSDSKRPLSMLAVTFEGILTVTDAEIFKNALCQGIGREKSYGMGLLTIVRR